MKKYLCAMALFFLGATSAMAAAHWVIIPETTLAPSAATVSGSFLFDTTNGDVSEINIKVVGGPHSGTYTVLGQNRSDPLKFFYARKTGASGPELGKPILLFGFSPGAFDTIGPSTLLLLNVGSCLGQTGNACTLPDASGGAATNSPVTVSASPPAPPAPATPSSIPTLSEWGLIALASILGLLGIASTRRRRS